MIVQAGKNCWRVERASHFYCVQDAADYFRLVRHALLSAQKTVFILGWDITAQIDLDPNLNVLDEPRASRGDPPTRLDRLLAYIARRRPQLRCYILTWDYGALYTLERDPFTRWRLGWRTPRSVRFGFDDRHPVGGCHHQKVVVIDDQLAFCGGIDLTGHRWDTCAHRVEEPARKTPIGVAYDPYHEVQAMVMGPVAASLGQLARDRWRAVRSDTVPPLNTAAADDGRSTMDDGLWPSVTPDITDADVAIVRTMPASDSRPAIRECEALFFDSIAMAKRTIYIENQYFTNEELAGALAARLEEPDGPEVVVISPKECQGWLEKTTMGTFRDSAFRRLIAADRHNRLRLVYPVASRSRDVPTFVHSKVMIVDGELARIGSANFSHRSMGTDTECDVAVDAGGDARIRAGIWRMRDRLLAEHLGTSANDVARELERAGSIRALIDTRNNTDHALVRIVPSVEVSSPSPILQAVADPHEPIADLSSAQALIPTVSTGGRHSPLRLWILPSVVLIAALVVAWRLPFSLDFLPRTASSLWVAIGLFVLAGVLLVPLELLALAAAVLFGGLRGGLVALLGSLAAAVIGYIAGRMIGAPGLTKWISPRSYRSVRQLSARGVRGMIALRFANIASAGAIHLLCGARRMPFETYITGTVIALAPTIAALSGLGSLLRHTLLNPTLSNGLATIGAAVVLVALVAVLRAAILIRQFAAAVSSHRTRAEFG